jgi:hypothetical protein
MTRLPHPLPVVVAGCLLASATACSSPAAEGGGNNEPATGANQTLRFGVGTSGKVSAPSTYQVTVGQARSSAHAQSFSLTAGG